MIAFNFYKGNIIYDTNRKKAFGQKPFFYGCETLML